MKHIIMLVKGEVDHQKIETGMEHIETISIPKLIRTGRTGMNPLRGKKANVILIPMDLKGDIHEQIMEQAYLFKVANSRDLQITFY